MFNYRRVERSEVDQPDKNSTEIGLARWNSKSPNTSKHELKTTGPTWFSVVWRWLLLYVQEGVVNQQTQLGGAHIVVKNID